ncbi:MAG TPA: phosphomethylpyrimidine synthase ThiC [Candidatus Goldiibacteriota bacterium]|nr:phosphomethylpyrimidine synthase ThiC [Candidatus Goldiibacteriota bacterium]
MTQLEAAKKGIITEEMKQVAQQENINVKELCGLVAKGEVVITKNKNRSFKKLIGIGSRMRVKVNANIGSSQDVSDVTNELIKLKASIDVGADTVMDLSTGGDIKAIRKAIIEKSSVPIGTVPIYETAVNALNNKKSIDKITADEFFATIEEHAKEGVDFITVHCGLNQKSLSALISQGRLLDIVSRGGSMLAVWIMKNNMENPLYADFDRLLQIAYEYDLTLSLGDGMRPGCLADATDRAQIQELITLGELAKRAYEKNVQVMIEGPGHVPLNEIEANIKLQKSLCKNAPFYVLGPIVTDIAPGYDHITSAIGGALAAYFGADFLCYVTSAEHLKLPDIEEVKEGVIVSRIAAHAADIARGYPGARDIDDQMALARKNLDWEKQISLAINPDLAKKLREKCPPENKDVCSMCGEFCAIKELKNVINKI